MQRAKPHFLFRHCLHLLPLEQDLIVAIVVVVVVVIAAAAAAPVRAWP